MWLKPLVPTAVSVLCDLKRKTLLNFILYIVAFQTVKKLQPLSERLASLDLMVAQLRAPHNPSIRQCCHIPRGFSEALMMPRDASLSDGCTYDCCRDSCMTGHGLTGCRCREKGREIAFFLMGEIALSLIEEIAKKFA